jgi:hypothetical protein
MLINVRSRIDVPDPWAGRIGIPGSLFIIMVEAFVYNILYIKSQ